MNLREEAAELVYDATLKIADNNDKFTAKAGNDNIAEVVVDGIAAEKRRAGKESTKATAEPDSKEKPTFKGKDYTKNDNGNEKKKKTNLHHRNVSLPGVFFFADNNNPKGTIDCSHVLITSTGGVGSSQFIKTMGTILKNQSRMKVNNLRDADGFKHKPATLVKYHNSNYLKIANKTNGEDTCFHKALVIIGDPLHAIESTYRRFKHIHINKLKSSSGLGVYKKNITLEKIYLDIARTGKDQTGFENYVQSWYIASQDRSNWPEIKLVTSHILFENAVNISRWLGVSDEDDLNRFSNFHFDPTKRKTTNITPGIPHRHKKRIRKVFENVTAIIDRIEEEGYDSEPKLVEHFPTRCINGPYIYDRSKHLEGIGSTFQHRKFSLIFSEAIRGTWIGTLINAHDGRKSTLNKAHIFGLQDNDCTEADLLNETLNKHLQFSYIEGRSRNASIQNLCEHIAQNTTFQLWENITTSSVIVFDEDVVRSDWNYCLFNPYFRQRFQQAQRVRNANFRPPNVTWISIHFRWGDTRTSSVESPNRRAGAGLLKYIEATRYQQELHNSSQTQIHFFSEGEPTTFVAFQDAFPSATLHLNSTSWIEALDIMSQSNVLIGGQSSFFCLASHLCEYCKVITATHRGKKFSVKKEELSLARHHNMSFFSS